MEEPVLVENNCASFAQNLNNNTGFPFDDSDNDSNEPFQSRLNDIAARHPEFASHLRLDDFPSLRRKRHTPEETSHTSGHFPGSSTGSSGTSHRFPSSFNRFPFSHHFDDEEEFGNFNAQKPPEVPKQENKETGKRERKRNPNLPQHLSNTVDLGQKQPSVAENRNQRSMSAPPENRTSPRVEPDSNPAEDMGKNFSRQNQPPPQQPRERIIPIHVEGRDDPVMPKNPNIGTEKVFGGEKIQTGFGNTESFGGRQNDPHAPYRRQMYEQYIPKQQNQTNQQNYPQNQQFGNQQFSRQKTPPQNQSSKQQTPPQQTPPRQQMPSQQTPPRQHTPPQQAPLRQQATPPPCSNDPFDKIKSVRNDVMELMTQVEKFSGTRKDHEYLYLDEMLTRNLIKLDDVETEGKENIRLARKEAIKCIQTCISNLEAKAQAKELELKAGKSENSVAQKEDQQETTENQIFKEENATKSEGNIVQSIPDQQTKEASPPKYTSQATLIISPPEKQQKIEDQSSGSTTAGTVERMEVEETNTNNETPRQMETEEKTNESSQMK